MPATVVAPPFDKRGWVYEEKYDGDRILAYKEGALVLLLSRNGKHNTGRFPAIAAAIEKLRPATLLLDAKSWYLTAKAFHVFSFSSRKKASRRTPSSIASSPTARICVTSRSRRAARPWKRSLQRKASRCFPIASPQTASKPTRSRSGAATKAS